ncbi:MAG: hydrogenase iron-sulfur subunit [Candidatus Heimdallarchaeota archaeon]
MPSEFEPRVVIFCCKWCSYAAADGAGLARMEYPSNAEIVKVPCSGKVDALYILKAFEYGADGVLVTGCLLGSCHYLDGNFKAENRVKFVQNLLDEIGFGSERLRLRFLSSAMSNTFVEEVREMVDHIRALGPSPLTLKKITVSE